MNNRLLNFFEHLRRILPARRATLVNPIAALRAN
jgi:hypothetical protein